MQEKLLKSKELLIAAVAYPTTRKVLKGVAIVLEIHAFVATVEQDLLQ